MADDPRHDDDIVIELVAPAAPAGSRKPGGMPVDEARAFLKQRLQEIIAEVLDAHGLAMNNPFLQMANEITGAEYSTELYFAIKATVGIGKSELLRQAIIKFIAEAKRLGYRFKTLFLVPTHKLGQESESKMPAGISSMVWQGRDAVRLGSTTEKMCLNPVAVKAALDIGAPVETTACRKKIRGMQPITCAFYEGKGQCAYQAQKEIAGSADVIFAAHEIGFSVPPAMGKIGLTIIDEGFWQKGLGGIAPKSRLSIESLVSELADAPVRAFNGEVDMTSTMQLRYLTERLEIALSNMKDGYVTRAELIDAGLVPADEVEQNSGHAARLLEWRRKLDPRLKPNSSDDFRNKVVKKLGWMRRIPRRAAMWHAIEDLLAGNDVATGRLRLETEDGEEGRQRYIRVLTRRDLAAKVMNSPVIYADATAPIALVQNYLPALQLGCDIHVEAPNMKVYQVIGMPVGKMSLEPKPAGKRKGKQWGAWTETSEQCEERVTRKRARLVAAVKHLTRGKRGLVVCYESIEADFFDIPGVETTHFGMVEGIDRWKDVDVLIMIGRPLPKTRDIENMAAAVTGRPIKAGELLVHEGKVLNGRLAGRTIKRRVYANAEADAIRQAVTEAAIEQVIGRCRGINRTAANPCEVYLVLDDVVLPNQMLTEALDISDIEPDAIDLMLAAGIEPELPTDAAKLFPGLFPSREAAKKAYHRDRQRTGSGARGARLVTSLTKESLGKRCHQPPREAFFIQPGGRGQLRRYCIVDPALVPDPRAVLESALGPLKVFERMEPE
jgi:hypothetical protein